MGAYAAPKGKGLGVSTLLAERTVWGERLTTPLRSFLRTETSSAAVLLGGAVAALVWVNVDAASYDKVWGTSLSIHLGSASLGQDLRGWVNSGLMTFFFFVVGLEARREFDIGELRERRRVALPLLAGLGGMAIPVVIFLGFNAGEPSASGWGAAMSTDTAFALAMFALVSPKGMKRARAFLLTVVVVDDVVALVVIATAYTSELHVVALLVALALVALGLIVRWLRVSWRPAYALLAVAMWVAVFKSGIDPVVVGLVIGLLVYARPAARTDLELASVRFREFREQPTPELARQARAGVDAAISPNERLQYRFHPWTSFVIVPLFALVNAGIPLHLSFLAHAFASPITLGIFLGFVLGKPVGIASVAWLTTHISRGRLRPPVGWVAVAGGGAIAGIPFTVSLLIAALAFKGTALLEAKAGILAAAVAASLLSWLVFRVTALLPQRLRIRALLGTASTLVDLADPVEPERDHIRGPLVSPVTVVEYGDFECPYCGQAEPIVRELLAGFADLRYVWRHLPLSDVHPHAQLAAEASEAASVQGAFWEMHDLLLEHQDALRFSDLLGYATDLGLDVDRFADDLRQHTWAQRVASDIESADLSDASGTPTFFINGVRHHGAYDIDSLSNAVRAAKARAKVAG
jgi:Na+/H+ antiporter NhaA